MVSSSPAVKPKLPSPITETVFVPGRPKCAPTRRRHRVAERAVRAVGDEVPPGFAELVVGGEIRAGRARVADHDRVARQHFVQRGDDALGQDRHVVRDRRARGTPRTSPLSPRDADACRRRRFALRRAAARRAAAQRELRVADQRDLGLVVGAEHHRVDVDMDDRACPAPDSASARWSPSRRGSRRRRPGRPASSASRVGSVPPLLPTTPSAERMVLGEAALAADGGGDRRAEQLGERGELALGAGDHHAAAADEDRQSCRGAAASPLAAIVVGIRR